MAQASPGPLAAIAGNKRTLLAVAAPAEAEAVAAAFGRALARPIPAWTLEPLEAGVEMVVTGVSKAAAAGAVARVLEPGRHGFVLSVGIAGSLTKDVRIGQVVLAERCDLADDGVLAPDGFTGLGRMGFGPFRNSAQGAAPDRAVIRQLTPFADVLGPVATVSVCSGTNAAAAALAARGYVAEAMEGAAVALVAEHLNVPFGELRVISNTTGDRVQQKWELRPSLAKLTELLGRLREARP